MDGKAKIIVDGGIRSGVDVFKALAMGADAVLIARPFVTAVYGGAGEGVQAYIGKDRCRTFRYHDHVWCGKPERNYQRYGVESIKNIIKK